MPRLKVLFLCTGNSCRSQMAEGWAHHLKDDVIEAYSAGIEKHGMNPHAVRVMAEAGVDISRQYSKTPAELGPVAFDYVVQGLMRKDSLELTDADRAAIRAAVEAAPERHVLITHGTDTMPETARALLGIRDKVVVLTGGLYPARFRWTDAIFNVGGAVAAVWTLPPGVWVVVNGRVYAGDKVRKDRVRNRFEELP